ncbi:hypothetical protein [Corynebacterium curieae]|uniref:hypothetical protein n=1 Tax=Corynebacterium curieae TaxID=2913500 RepID=UPI0022B9DCA0|nr:hypothetical protein [Corynebacterium curieae]
MHKNNPFEAVEKPVKWQKVGPALGHVACIVPPQRTQRRAARECSRLSAVVVFVVFAAAGQENLTQP